MKFHKYELKTRQLTLEELEEEYGIVKSHTGRLKFPDGASVRATSQFFTTIYKFLVTTTVYDLSMEEIIVDQTINGHTTITIYENVVTE